VWTFWITFWMALLTDTLPRDDGITDLAKATRARGSILFTPGVLVEEVRRHAGLKVRAGGPRSTRCSGSRRPVGAPRLGPVPVRDLAALAAANRAVASRWASIPSPALALLACDTLM